MVYQGLITETRLFILQGQNANSLKPAAFLLPILTLVFVGFQLYRMAKKPFHQKFYTSRWFYILLLSLIPLLFTNATPFDGTVLGFTGESYQPIMPLLAGIPAILAVGVVGPVAAVIIAILTGAAQVLLFQQDLSLLMYYPVLVTLFTYQVNESLEDTTNPRVVIAKLIETAMLLLLFWMLYQFGLAFVYGLRDAIAVLTQAIFLWIMHLPEIILAAVALSFLLRYFPAEWKPKTYLNESRNSNLVTSIIDQVSELSKGNYDHKPANFNRTQGERAINEAIEDLRKSLQVRTDTQSRLLSLDPSHYSREGYDLVMSSILRAALTRDASAARLILLGNIGQSAKPEMRLRIGQGEHTRNYAYLDVLILEKIADQDQLVLSDIKIDDYFGLTPGTPYPKSIVALQLRGNEGSRGALWVGFEQNRWFSNEEIDFYRELGLRATAALNTKDQITQVRKEKTWLNEVLNSIPDPIVVVDVSGEVVFENFAGQNLSQLPAGLVIASQNQKSIPQSVMVELMQKHKAANDKEKTIRLGEEEYRVEILPVKLEGKETGTIVYLRDNRQNNQAVREKSEFVSNISHDLRSPLKLMGGYTRLIKHIGNLSSQQNILVDRLESGIEDMRRLVNKVLELERLDNDAGLMYTTFDFKEMVNESIDMLEVQAQQKKITIHTDFGSLKTPYISADRILTQQAIYNLIENAIKFSPRGETVLIRAEKDASWMHLSIKDNGKGIAPLDQTRIFNRFFHMDDEQNFDNRGQGLGLSIVKSIAEKHGGSISVDSKLGSGSIFHLDIPLHRLEGLKNLTKHSD
jgi:two-component system sensor histidine kinase ResE